MSGHVLDGITAASNAVVLCVKSAWDDSIEFGCWMGRQVEEVTDKSLPKPLNIIAQRAFNSLPVILAWQLLPSAVMIPAALIFGAIHLIDQNPFSKQTYRNVYDGLAFNRLLFATECLALFAVSGDNINYFIQACIHTVIAYGIFSKVDSI